MSRADHSTVADREIRSIREALQPYQRAHTNAGIEVRRYNPVAVRIRIIDPDFKHMDRADREEQIWPLLASLPEDTVSEITMLLLLTPEERHSSLANLEFEDPSPSLL